jgi:quercetin 2,3-dioxygenase
VRELAVEAPVTVQGPLPKAPLSPYAPPMKIRRGRDRGLADYGWLKSFHTFSFADYYDPRHMGISALRVINEDRVQAGRGFGAHPHRDMEILSYVLEGELEHKDSMGTGSVIRPGDVQRMSAGTGVRHSEFNPSKNELVHFLQIWIIPDRAGYQPSYEQKTFSSDEKSARLRLIASNDGRDGSVTVHQNVAVYAGSFGSGERASHTITGDRQGWLQVVRGSLDLNGERLEAGDGAAFEEAGTVEIVGQSACEAILFDLP